MPEERKLVTVLFADVVGSTEMGLSRDPEVVRASLGRAFEQAKEALEAHGGTVEKFIGDAVMAVFGVPMVHDDDPDRAVRAAFALRDRVTAGGSGGPVLQVRIGINTGEAVAGTDATAQFLVTGPAVNAAARLQQAASPGEIVVGDLTKRLTSDGVEYAPAREVDAKGIGRIAAWPAQRVVGAVPEQHRGLPGLRAPLIGRDHELATLIQVHAGLAHTGRPHLVTVYAPAGAGKSRLTSELLDTIGRDRVRIGRCLPYGQGITYYAVQLIVRADAGIDIAEPRASAIAKLRAAAREVCADDPDEAEGIARRVGVLAGLERAEEALPEVLPASLKDELAFGLRRYLELRAGSSPLVLVFEDVHWAEPGLLELIEDLAEWARTPLMLLCLARPDFRDTRPAWGGGAANATAITLAPLSPEETRRLIAELLAIDDLPDSVRDEVVTRAEGNPLYVEEFLRLLMETGRIEKRGDRWVATAAIAGVEVPPTLQGLITARLDRVGPEVKAMLQRASLAGRLFSTDALAALADGEKPEPGLLRDAIRRDLLVEADERALGSGRVFRFKHVLIRDVAYSTLPKSERSRLHDRYGRWLEASLGDRRHEIVDIVAHHAEQAFMLARELGSSAAADLGRRALDLLLEAAHTAYDRVDYHAALNLYQRAGVVADGGGATPAERAEIAGRQLLLRDDLSRDRIPPAEVEAAIELARAARPNRALPDLLQVKARLVREAGDAPMASLLNAEALDAARELGDADLVTEMLWERGYAAYYDGDFVAMHERLLEAREHAVRTGSKSLGKVLFWLGKAALNRGDVTRMREYSDESRAKLPYRSRFFRAIEHSTAAWDHRDIGDFTTMLGEAEQAVALFREIGQPSFIAGALWILGEALLELGDHERARAAFAEAADLFVRRGQRGQIPEVRARLARALVRLGRVAEARTEAEAAQAIAMADDIESRYIAAVAVGEVREAEGDLRAAETAFREAIGVSANTGFGYVTALAREQYGAFLLRRDRRDEGRAVLQEVREFWHDPLAARHRDRIDALLRRAAPLKA